MRLPKGDSDAKQTLADRGKSEVRQKTTEPVDGAKQKVHDTLASFKSLRTRSVDPIERQ